MAEGGAIIIDPTTHTLSLFLVQISIILILVRIVAKCLVRLKQPSVIGEIIAGILLGPSVLGFIPGFSATIFPQSSIVILSVFANIGLIFFMFYLGLEVEIEMLTRNWKAAAPVAVASIIMPFLCGIGISFWFYDLEPTIASETTFLLFIGTALSFTAFPVLARIMASFRLLDSGVGVHALSIAAIDDVFAWCVLAITLSYAGGGPALNGLYTMLITIAFVLVLVFAIRPFLVKAGQFFSTRVADDEEFSRDYVGLLFLLLACSAIWTEITGVHAFFGAFAFGIIVPKEHGLVPYLAPRLELLIVDVFLPIYFVTSGLQTTFGELNTGELWGKAIALIVISTVSKLVPVMLITKLTSIIFFVDASDPDESIELNPEEKVAPAGAISIDVDKLGDRVGSDEVEMAEIIKQHHQAIRQQGAFDKTVEEAKSPEDHREDSVRGAPHQSAYPSPASGGTKHYAEETKEEAASGSETGSSQHTNNTLGRSTDGSSSSGMNHMSVGINNSAAHLHDGLMSSNPGSSSNTITADSGIAPPLAPPKKFESLSWRVCFSIGVLMNTRGLVALIALNIGKEKGIVGPKVFSLCVLMSLATTFMTSPLFEYYFYKPYMAERREKREARRQMAETERRIQRQRSGLPPVDEEEEETESQRIRRQQKEDAEEDRLMRTELSRMSIKVHSYERGPAGLMSPTSADMIGAPRRTQSFSRLPIQRGRTGSISTHDLMMQSQPAGMGMHRSVSAHPRAYRLDDTDNHLMQSGPSRFGRHSHVEAIDHHQIDAELGRHLPRGDSPPPHLNATGASRFGAGIVEEDPTSEEDEDTPHSTPSHLRSQQTRASNVRY